MMKFLLHSTLLAAAAVGLVLPAAAQARTYQVITAEVPFKFNVGHRTFRPGQYQFIIVGTGLLAIRDAKSRIIASIVTRPIQAGEPLASTQIVFKTQKKPARLTQIRLATRSQILEILGEQVAMPSSPPTESLPPWSFSFTDRSGLPRLRH